MIRNRSELKPQSGISRVSGVVLVTGGSRSGKSAFAQNLAESSSDERVYIATCPRVDEELACRIERHKQERQGKGWQTIEEELDIVVALRSIEPGGAVVIDCLTLWINNILFRSSESKAPTEDEISSAAVELLEAAEDFGGTVILVTNEVGMGLVPPQASSRLYRDLVGRCNQTIAKGADQVVFMVSGIPLYLKGGR